MRTMPSRWRSSGRRYWDRGSLNQLDEERECPANAMKGAASHISQIDNPVNGQVAKLTDIANSAAGSIRDALAGTNLGFLPSSFSSSLADEAARAFDASGLKLPDYDLSGAFENITPNYTIPDYSLGSLDTSSYSKFSWQQLIILGNGFDLQCGLRSRFGDFFKSRFEKIVGIKRYDRATWKGLLEGSDLTLWDFILEANIDDAWCDVEGAIEKWILSAADTDPNTSLFWGVLDALGRTNLFTDGMPYIVWREDGKCLASEKDNKDHLCCNIARYALTINPELSGKECASEQLIKLLKRDLGRLERAFGAYLSKEISSNNGYAGECKNLCRIIAEDGKQSDEDFYVSTSVLSFNYTSIAENHFDKGDDGVFVNIHGKLGEDIIFGIDGKDCMDNPIAVSFTKTYRLMLRGGSRTGGLISTANSSNLQDATDVIKFYGHSLGRADYSYFQSIFDGVDLYESKTVLVFYFPLDSSDDAEMINNERRSRLANSINNLLVAYGATMDNSDHGKNLMHKLLLEGRLIIRGLSVD